MMRKKEFVRQHSIEPDMAETRRKVKQAIGSLLRIPKASHSLMREHEPFFAYLYTI